ncbi:MAG: hypothetical protein LBC96_02745 [Lachnospiraceae bacterium]|jgi:hypothetical protein|nr:hypothetical protein [Lachnospiraceae bacterium]
MKKKDILKIVLLLIFPVIFNIFFYVIGGTQHNTSVWISYVFVHIAYLSLIIAPKLISQGKSQAVFGFTLYAVTTVYFIIAFVIAVLFILIAPEKHTAALLLQLLLTAIYIAVFISNIMFNERTATAEEARQVEIAYVKDAAAKLKELKAGINDRNTKKAVERVYDSVYSSPVKSHPSLSQLESDILQSIDRLASLSFTANPDDIINLAKDIENMANERNSQLKMLN